MLKKILIAVAVVILGLVAFVGLQPSEYKISRSTTVAISPAAAFEQANDFRNWKKWSPWKDLDPDMKMIIEDKPFGKGAILLWAGAEQVGEGRMTIVDSRSPDQVRMQLEFFKPYESTSTTEFNFKPEGNKTLVTWSMSGQRSFVEKAFCLAMNGEKKVGDVLEKGLANMKVHTETVIMK